MGSKFCVKFQRAPLKFHTKFWTHTPQNMNFTVFYFCVWITMSLNCDVISLSETGPRTDVCFIINSKSYIEIRDDKISNRFRNAPFTTTTSSTQVLILRIYTTMKSVPLFPRISSPRVSHFSTSFYKILWHEINTSARECFAVVWPLLLSVLGPMGYWSLWKNP